MRVKVALISALAYRPLLLVLDEPISGLDPAARAEFLEELREEISRDPGTRAVIISSHVLEDITAIADEVIFIKDGELVGRISIHDLSKDWQALSLGVPSGVNVQHVADSCQLIGERNGATLLLCPSAGLAASKAKLAAAGVEVMEVRAPTLQELFLALA
jgi:ABC-2 type transport system ATP-binding protein